MLDALSHCWTAAHALVATFHVIMVVAMRTNAIPSKASSTMSHRSPLAHALSAALHVTTFGWTLNCNKRPKIHNALCHHFPFSHALSAALYVITFGARPFCPTTPSKLNACGHHVLFPQVPIAELYVTMVASNAKSPVSLRSCKVPPHSLPMLHSLNQALQLAATSHPRTSACAPAYRSQQQSRAFPGPSSAATRCFRRLVLRHPPSWHSCGRVSQQIVAFGGCSTARASQARVTPRSPEGGACC
mmetsp:Transcript_14909/g.46974  ORF Transcript_14909/g.46974 Transcript_14909/m.46974 type:complete len:245 (-) Transcript_14909:11-745(-)